MHQTLSSAENRIFDHPYSGSHCNQISTISYLEPYSDINMVAPDWVLGFSVYNNFLLE